MKKVIIIGAGPAGITAGYELKKQSKDFQVVILEADQSIGGISKTVCVNGNRMDMGGHRFFSKDSRVEEWWEEIMPLQGAPAFDDKLLGREISVKEGGPNPEVQDKVMLKRKRISRIYYRKHFFDYPIKLNINTFKGMGIITALQVGISYLKSMFYKLPEDSLENFYINRFGKKLYQMFFEGYTEKLWGEKPKNISADWGAQRVKGLSVLTIIKNIIKKKFMKNMDTVETSLIEEFKYPKYGPGQLWETVAEKFENMGGEIRRGCTVCKIITEFSRVTGISYIEHGIEKTESADYVISSMPLKNLIEGMNDVPQEVVRVSEGLPYRDFVTVGLLMKKIALDNKTVYKTLGDIVPDCWIYIQDDSVKLGRIQIFNNWSPYMVEKPETLVWVGAEYFCTEGDEYWNMNDEQWEKMACRELLKIGIIDSEKDILEMHCEKVKKAYPAYFGTYKEINKVITYLNKFENLYCIGRNGQHRYNNMDHSMVTAFETVKNIVYGNNSKMDIWNVNMEKTYHEEK